MPNTFVNKNGSTIAGHSHKWKNKNRRPNSFLAGEGGAASRKQGYGAAGIANTIPSDEIDTTKMSPDEKLKYFRSLGLLAKEPEPVQEPVKEPEPVQEPEPEEEPQATKSFSMQSFVSSLSTALKSDPKALNDVAKALKGIPKQYLPAIAEKADSVLNTLVQKGRKPNEIGKYLLKLIAKEIEEYGL